MSPSLKAPPSARMALACAVLAFSSCTAVEPPASVELIDLAVHENQLIRPFLDGQSFVCSELLIEISPALLHKFVGYPAGAPVRHETENYTELAWSTADRIKLSPTAQRPLPNDFEPRLPYLTVRIGNKEQGTAFLVDKELRIRLPHRAPPTLTAVASGHVMVTRDSKQRDYFSEVHFRDGDVRAAPMASAPQPGS